MWGMPLRVFCILLLLCASQLAIAADKSVTKLASAPLWLDLLHMNQGGTWHGRGRSYVTDPAFFLAKNGATNPLAEMRADIAAFRQPANQARCRFPARFHFLAQQLGWQISQPFANCPDFLKWRQKAPDQQAVLIFPAAYLNSPSSMFGHLFLRLDASRHPDNVLSSWAVSFAANTDVTDGSFFYAFKGIVGSYPGYFSVSSYAKKVQQYSHLENRDIWEYRLNLNPREMQRLVNHLWELKQTRFSYYFFDENCAYRLLGLIQVARPSVPLQQQLRLSQVPVDAIRELQKKGVVDGKHYRPSKETQLRWEAVQLPAAHQQLAKQIAQQPALAEQQTFQALTAQARFQVANLAYNYLRYRQAGDGRKPKAAAKSFALLRLIHANSTHSNSYKVQPLPEPPAPVSPDKGHGTHLLAISAGQRESVGYTQLTWRYTYHDWLDNALGFLPGASIEGLDMTLRYYWHLPNNHKGDSLRLQSLQLVNIRSLSPRGRFIKPISWFVDGGLEQTYTAGRYRLSRYLQGGPGLAWQWGKFVPYAYLKARLENNSAYAPLIEAGAGSEIGLLYTSGTISALAKLDGIYFHNGDWRAHASLGINVALGRNNALRITASHARHPHIRFNEWQLGWRHYF